MVFGNPQPKPTVRAWSLPTTLAILAVLIITVSGVVYVFGPPVIAFSRLPWQQSDSKKIIALTFDDGPNGQATRRIVDILRQENVPATFFMVGKSVAADPGTARYVADHGLAIGNHTWDHAWEIPSMDQAHILQELAMTSQAIADATGQHPQLMRWPHGLHGPDADRAAEKLGLQAIDWQFDPGDYATNNADLLRQRTIDNVRDGDIVLFHDGLQDGQFAEQLQHREATIIALPKIITTLRARGFTFVSVDELNQSHHPTSR